MTTTVGALLDRARGWNPLFEEVTRHPNRRLVEFVATRQLTYLRELAELLKERFSQSRSIADTINGDLVGVDENGSLFTISIGDGYAVIQGLDGNLYLVEPAISTDPYANGFPLPVDSFKLLTFYATFGDTNQTKPIRVVHEQDTGARGGQSELTAIISRWRLFPLVNPTDAGSEWDSVTSVTIAWLPAPPRFSLVGAWREQVLTIPSEYDDPLEYELALFMAGREVHRDKNFAPLLQWLAEQAKTALDKAKAAASRDFQGVKFSQTKVNR